MKKLWFVTPAWSPYDLSKICFAQRRWVCDELAKSGIEANCVVICDDANIDIAESFGFHIVIQNNEYLGRRFNDGYRYAARKKADYVVTIGSDSWIHPNLILALIPQRYNRIKYSRLLSVVRSDGEERLDLDVLYQGGGQRVYPLQLFKKLGYRPIPDNLERACDGATFDTLSTLEDRVTWETIPDRHLELVGFQSNLQITKYDNLKGRWCTNVSKTPFRGLHKLYHNNFIRAIQAFYAHRIW